MKVVIYIRKRLGWSFRLTIITMLLMLDIVLVIAFV